MADDSTEGDDSTTLGNRSEAEIRELMGMFDAPSFARRGRAMESHIEVLHERCRAHRSRMLDMVRMRLKQWTQAAGGPDDWRDIFTAPISDLWPLSQADDPQWAGTSQPVRRRRGIANDLIATVNRFNARWSRHVNELKLGPINEAIRQYNQYYILEKECMMGSSRLATRFFRPLPPFTVEAILNGHPLLPVPELV